MRELLVSLALLFLGGLLSVGLGKRAPIAHLAGQIGAIAGSALGLLGAIRVLVDGEVQQISGVWPMPGGSLHLEIDALSAFFLLPVFGLSVVTGLYGRSYLATRQAGRGEGSAVPSQPADRRDGAGDHRARRAPLPPRLGGHGPGTVFSGHFR